MIKPFLFSRTLAGMVLLGLSLLISACGGGGSGGGGGGGSSFVDVVASSFSGSVGDGPIVQGTVKIYDRKGQLLQTEVSDVYASYTTSLEAEEDAYPLILEVTDGTDLVTNREPDFTLISVVLDPSVTQVNINPYTMIIVEVARNMPGGITAENISAARLIIMEKLNFGLDPAYVADPLGTRITDQNVAVMVKASEALGEMIRRTRDQLMAIGLATTGDDIVAALAHDLVDGKLDGNGGGTASTRVAAVSLLTSAQVLIEALSNNLEVDGEVATGRMDDSIVATRPSVPLSSLTNSVPINQEQLEQARDTIKVAQALSPSVELDAIATILDSLSAGSTASDVEAVLPAGTSETLDQPVAIAVAANDEDLDTAINVVSTDNPTDPPVGNTAPVLSGTPATTVLEDASYLYQPVATDSDGDMLTFGISNRPSWASFNTSTGRLSGTPRNGDVGTKNNILITVSDGAASDSIGPFSITVSNTNDAPTISGTPGSSVAEDSAYNFQPSASDPDANTTLSFSISGKPSWAIFSTSTGRLSGTPRNGDAGSYSNIRITVSDGSLSDSIGPFSITVSNTNDAPTISGTPASSVAEDSAYNFQPSASDPDANTTLSFSISGKPSWAIFSTSTGRLSGTPRNGDAGSYSNIRITVSDGSLSDSIGPFSITVSNTNDAPTISGTPASSVAEDSAYSFQPSASDPDANTTLSFSISGKPSWAIFSTSTGRLSGTPRNGDAGSYSNIRITVSDGSLSDSIGPFSITVSNTNDAPTISGTPASSVAEDSAYSFQPSASDPDANTTLSFSISGKPSWAIFSTSTGRLSGTPRNGDAGSYSNIRITVSDGSLSDSIGPFSITVSNTNDAPTISGTPASSVAEDSAYSFQPSASDPDANTTLSFSISGKPSWAIFSTSTGRLSGTPRNGDAGSYSNIRITVSDGSLSDSIGPFSITVSNTNDAPTISGTPASSVAEDSAYSFQPSASDPDANTTLSFSISGKPSWAIFSTSTGRLSGTPRNGDAGSYSNIRITVSDGSLSDSIGPFSITVSNTNDAPTISGTPASSVAEDSAYSFQPSASDPDANTTLSFSISGKPSWAIFSTSTGRLSGTPRNGDAGSYSNIRITVSDGSLSDSIGPFSITVSNTNDAPTISGTPASSVAEDSAYSFQPSASDPDANTTLSFSISGKPSWAIFSTSTGRLSGTPRNGDAGSYSNIRITVSDGSLSDSIGPFSITVSNTNDAPTISGTPASSVAEDSAYSFQPSASDPDANTTLSFSISGKPSWAIFSTSTGRLSGTPRNGDAGSYSNIRITVSDGSLSDSIGPFSITVSNTNDAPTISGTPASSVAEDSAYNFQPSASDPDANTTLSFSISGKPSWAIFSTSTGRLSGTPRNGDAGSYSNIRITVSDGSLSDSIGPFSITVDPAGSQTGDFSVSWTAPVSRADGQPFALAERGGYRIYFGDSSGTYTDVADVTDVTATSWSVTNVPVGTRYVVMTTLDVDGRESGYSQEISKPVQ